MMIGRRRETRARAFFRVFDGPFTLGRVRRQNVETPRLFDERVAVKDARRE